MRRGLLSVRDVAREVKRVGDQGSPVLVLHAADAAARNARAWQTWKAVHGLHHA